MASMVSGGSTFCAETGEAAAGNTVQAVTGRVRSFRIMAEEERAAPPAANPVFEMPFNLISVPTPSVLTPISALSGSGPVTRKNALPAALATPLPKTGFAALDDNDRAIPPDTQGAVGPHHLIVALNTQVRIQSRSGEALDTVTLFRFWTNLVDGIVNTFDPRVLYDSQADRWILVTGANGQRTNSMLLVAVTETSDPTGNWFGLGLPGDSSQVHWADFPIVGLNSKWLVITATLYTVGTNKFGLSRVNVLDKNKVYGKGPTPILAKTFDDKAAPVLSASIDYDQAQAKMYFVNAVNGNSSGKGFLRLSSLAGELGLEAYDPGTAFPSTTSTWAAFPNPQDFAPQLGSDKKIHVGDHRILNSVALRNGSLWLAHSVFLPAEAPVRAAVQWWELNLDGSVRQFGRLDDPAGKNFYAYPSLAVNKNNDVLIGYSRFSATQYVSANYTFRAITDPPNTLRADTVLKNGEAPYVKTVSGTRNRWGDYSSTVVDPLNDIDMWTLQQYAAARTNAWGTWWGRFALEPGGVPPSISSFTPSTGGAGTTVTIIGAKLTETTAVEFNGIKAVVFTIHSSSRVTAVVPPGASPGPIRVTTPDGAASSTPDFTVLPTPSISSFLPDRGGPNSTVVITGAHLTGATSVKFNEVAAVQFKVESATQLTATVPASATTGRILVATPNGTATSSNNFTVTLEPILTGFAPAKGPIGGIVTITGANLGTATEVRFNGVRSLQIGVVSATQVTAAVPPNAANGPIEVVTPNGTARSSTSFEIVAAPTITSFEPKSGFIGGSVTIVGANLGEASAVRFNGIDDLTFTVDSSRQISARVPVGAPTGRIAVTTPGGTAASADPFTVIAPPFNDPFKDAQLIAGGSGSVSGSNVGATKEPGEPDHATDAGSRSIGAGGRSIWYRWTAPANGTWNFHTAGSKIDTTLGVYTGTNVAQLTVIALNDDADAQTTTSSVSFLASAGTVYSIAVSGFRDTSGDIVLSWISTVAKPAIGSIIPTNGPLGSVVILLGANFTGTTEVKFNAVIAPEFTVDSANRITVRVPANATSGPLSVATGTGTTSSVDSFTVTPPVANDHFQNGLSLSGTSGSITGDNAGASFELGEPKHATVNAHKSVWYRWTAPASGPWTFDTLGSSFDTVLAVYTGNAVESLFEIASNDDAPGKSSSSLSLNAAAGTLYHIVVDGYASVSGGFALRWTFSGDTPKVQSFEPVVGDTGTSVTILGENFTTNSIVEFNRVRSISVVVESATRIIAKVPASGTTGPIRVTTARGAALSAAYFVVSNSDAPANDLFSDAQLMSGRAWVAAGRTTSASKEPDEPDHAGDTGGRSVWYRWPAPEEGVWIVSTAGSGFDTLLAVYSGDSLTNLTLVASNDDADGVATSKVQFRTKAGAVYRIAVDGYDGESGSVIVKAVPAAESKVVYATGFEAAEGYKDQQPLAGQLAWSKSGTGGQSVVSHPIFGGGQQVQVGGIAAGQSVRTSVWQPITNSLPVVQFSVSMLISESSNGQNDFFDWAIFNTDGRLLFSLDFDNFGSLISYALDDGQGTRVTGVSFENNRVYQLGISMDFRNNTWSASLDQIPLVSDAPVTTFGSALNLGYIDAAWLTDTSPGDNVMVFDNYRIVAETNAPPVILAQPQSQTVSAGAQAIFGVAARGTEPLSYQWRFNGEPVTGATDAVLIVNNALATHVGSYAVEVINEFGSVVSQAASLTVNVVNIVPIRLSAGSLLPDGRLPLTLTSSVGAKFAIEASTDLAQWTELITGVNTSGTFNYFEGPARNSPQRFFRARQF